MSNPDVERHAQAVAEGRLLHPVVVDGRKIVDGEHRLSLAYHRNPDTRVPVLAVQVQNGEPEVKKSKKVQKSIKRPSDTEAFTTYSSPAAGVDEAASHVYDDPDEQELNDEVADIIRRTPALTSYQAHVQAARKLRAPSVKKDEGALADSLVEVTRESRRAAMTPSQRQTITKMSRHAQETYLRSARPWSTGDTTVPVRKAVDTDAILAKADQLRKADPSISRVAAMRQAAGAA